jgi:hypothetical protein
VHHAGGHPDQGAIAREKKLEFPHNRESNGNFQVSHPYQRFAMLISGVQINSLQRDFPFADNGKIPAR